MFLSRLFVVLIFVFAVIGNNAIAGSRTLSVGSLHSKCRFYLKQPLKLDARQLSKQNVADMAICSAFIAGFKFGKVSANVMNETTGPYCLPKGYERGDRLIRNFVRWAVRNPRHEKRAAGYGIMRSLQEHYACDERDRKN